MLHQQIANLNIQAKSDHFEYFWIAKLNPYHKAESGILELEYFQVESDYLDYFWWKEHYTVHWWPEVKDRAFCTLCEKLNLQKTWDVTYRDFISWFKKDKCWQPSWLDLI